MFVVMSGKPPVFKVPTSSDPEEQFEHMMKYRPHYLKLFIRLAQTLLKAGAKRIDARSLFGLMRGFGEDYAEAKLQIGNQLSQYFADAAVEKCPDLKGRFIRRKNREKRFKWQ